MCNRIRTYEHEAAWGKALLTYDLEASLPSSVCQAGIIEVNQSLSKRINEDCRVFVSLRLNLI